MSVLLPSTQTKMLEAGVESVWHEKDRIYWVCKEMKVEKEIYHSTWIGLEWIGSNNKNNDKGGERNRTCPFWGLSLTLQEKGRQMPSHSLSCSEFRSLSLYTALTVGLWFFVLSQFHSSNSLWLIKVFTLAIYHQISAFIRTDPQLLKQLLCAHILTLHNSQTSLTL